MDCYDQNKIKILQKKSHQPLLPNVAHHFSQFHMWINNKRTTERTQLIIESWNRHFCTPCFSLCFLTTHIYKFQNTLGTDFQIENQFSCLSPFLLVFICYFKQIKCFMFHVSSSTPISVLNNSFCVKCQ